MEAMLLGDDDSSSGDSDNGGRGAPAAQAPPAAIAAPVPPPVAAPPGGGSDNLKERLKSLYSPAGGHPQMQQQRSRSSGGGGGMPQQNMPQQGGAPNPDGSHNGTGIQRQSSGMSSNSSGGGHSSRGSSNSGAAYHANRQARPSQPPPGQPMVRKRTDPYEPTPVSKILERQKQKMSIQQPQQVTHRGGPPQQQVSHRGGPPPQQVNHRGAPPPQQASHRGGAPPPSQRRASSYGGSSAPSHLGQRGTSLPGANGGGSSSMGPPPSYRPGVPQTQLRTSTTGGSTASSSSQQTLQTSNAAGGANNGAQRNATRERELKKQKETFLLFTRVLIKYLEQKDPAVHAQVKGIIKECAERNKRHERGYESVTASMRTRLKAVVSENYWSRAEAYLRQLMEQKSRNRAGATSGQGGNSSSGGPPRPGMPGAPGMRPGVSSKPNAPSQQVQHSRQPISQPRGGNNRLPAAPTTHTMPARSISTVRKEISAQRQALSGSSSSSAAAKAAAAAKYAATARQPAVQAPAPGTAAASTAAVAAYAAAKGKSSSGVKRGSTPKSAASATGPTATQQRKTSLSTASAVAQVEPEKIPPAILREYNEFMGQLDHAINIKDWMSTTLVLGKDTHTALDEAQRDLLQPRAAPSPATQSTVSFPEEGWSRANLISARNAWAKVRLREKRSIGDAAVTQLKMPSTAGTSEPETMPVTNWHNEDVAEDDGVLAALSEGTQIYIKSVLEKAIQSARQRQQVDGIRLWHQQVVSSGSSTIAAPSLQLRLGCDVKRQVARAQANAALTCKRMEEALEHQNDLPSRKRVLDDETLEEATSMSEISLRPRLGRAVEEAQIEAARAGEIAGGKFAGDPPLGRIPKKAKLEVVDFQVGMQLALRPGRHRASAVSGAFSY